MSPKTYSWYALSLPTTFSRVTGEHHHRWRRAAGDAQVWSLGDSTDRSGGREVFGGSWARGNIYHRFQMCCLRNLKKSVPRVCTAEMWHCARNHIYKMCYFRNVELCGTKTHTSTGFHLQDLSLAYQFTSLDLSSICADGSYYETSSLVDIQYQNFLATGRCFHNRSTPVHLYRMRGFTQTSSATTGTPGLTRKKELLL